MRFTHTTTYDAPVTEVGAMLDDPGYREEVIAAQGSKSGSARITQEGDTLVVVLDVVQPADGVPGFAKKLVGEEVNVVQREEWTSSEYADLHVAVPGRSGELVGSIELAEDDGRTTKTVDCEITARVPLIGAKIERLIGDLLLKALRAEEQVAHDYLSR